MERRSSDKRLYFGVILIVLGVILILERLNLIPEQMADLLISWQMLLVGIGILSLIGGNRTAGTILIIIGGTFMIPHFFCGIMVRGHTSAGSRSCGLRNVLF